MFADFKNKFKVTVIFESKNGSVLINKLKSSLIYLKKQAPKLTTAVFNFLDMTSITNKSVTIVNPEC